jgi:asparagine synthase (glutamine-hydrolysing)
MCGICGIVGDRAYERTVRMSVALTHRGPDDDGVHVDPELGAAIAARRLSIIDVEGGHQPLSNETGTVWAVLNGEIYNHPALQRHLRERGHTLATRSDTEVLVHLYEELGAGLVHALEGMFAFAVFDTERRTLLLGRDRFGEKPLVYALRDGELAFSSELTSLVAGLRGSAALDREMVSTFLGLGYVPGPRTIARDVLQVPPGSTLQWDCAGRTAHVDRYWSAPAQTGALGAASAEDLVRETEQRLAEAVRSRLVADVPTGVLLSGGVDSTLVAALARTHGPVRTFTIGYDRGDVDEREGAREAALRLGTDHTEFELSAEDVADASASAIRALDTPLADPAFVALHVLCRGARGSIKVAVGGEGADEIFGGYPRYRTFPLAERGARLVPRGASRSAVVSALSVFDESHAARRARDLAAATTTAERHLAWISDGRWSQARRLQSAPLAAESLPTLVGRIEDALAGPHDLTAALMRLDQGLYLVDNVLAKADRAGMLASLELRTPFLARELVEFAASIPTSTHLRGDGKALLRAVLRRVAPEVRLLRKTAFRTPIGAWLAAPLRPTFEALLADGKAVASDLLDADATSRLLAEHAAGVADHANVLWPAYVFALWLEDSRLST